MTAHEAEAGLPFAPLLEPLARWLETSARPAQVRSLGPYAPVLAQLLPQVRLIWPDCPSPAPPGAEPSQILEALTLGFRLLTGDRPALAVLDDRHWADPSTLLWLSYGLRRLPVGVLIVAILRSGEPRPPELERLLASLDHRQRLTRLELKPLSPAEVRSLLAAVLGRPRTQALAALDELLQRQLLKTTQDGQAYVVDHPLVARVVYQSLSPGQRQQWHLRLAGALAADPGGSAGIQLRHLVAGNGPVEEIARQARRAGQEASQRHAYAEAATFFETGLARSPGPTASEQIGLREGLALAYHGAGRWDEAIAVYEQLLEVTHDALARSRLRREMAQVLGDVAGRFDEALALLDQAQQELGPQADSARLELGRIEAARSVSLFYQGDYRRTLEHGRRALELWRGQPEARDDVAQELVVLGLAEQRLGSLDRAEAHFKRAHVRARLQGDRVLEARALDMLGGVSLHRGRLGEALVQSETALATFRELAVPKYEAIALVNVGLTLSWMGRFAEARRSYLEALARAEALGARYTVMHTLVNLGGEVLPFLGELDEAQQHLQEAIDLAQDIGNQQRLAQAYQYLGRVDLLRDRPARARTWVERGLSLGQAIGDMHSMREGNAILAEALLALGELNEAQGTAIQGLAAARGHGFVLSQGRNQLVLARIRSAQGEPEEASLALEEAAQIFGRAGARFEPAQTLLEQARLGLTAEPGAALTEALGLARACGGRWLVAQIEQARSSLAVAG